MALLFSLGTSRTGSTLSAFAIAALCVLAQACDKEEVATPTTGQSTTSPNSIWAARADSTRTLSNAPGVNYRLYVGDVVLTVTNERVVALDVEWTNAGPAAVAGGHQLVLQLLGPVDRPVPLDGIGLDGLAVGQSVTTSTERELPADIVSGLYDATLQLVRTTSPQVRVDIALGREFIDGEGRWGVGRVTVP